MTLHRVAQHSIDCSAATHLLNHYRASPRLHGGGEFRIMGSAFQGRAPICRTGFEQHGLHLVLCRGWLSFLLNPTAFPQDLHRFNFDGFLAFDSACCRRCCLAVLRDLRRMVQTGTAGIRNRRRRLPLAGIFSALDRTDILYLFVYRRNYPSRCISRAERTVACR